MSPTSPNTRRSRRARTRRTRRPPRTDRTFRTYAIELAPEVMALRDFREENPDRRADRPCVYVGYTAHTAEHRFEQHMADTRSRAKVWRYGIRLLTEWGRELGAVDEDAAQRAERRLARKLRNRGYGVWQR